MKLLNSAKIQDKGSSNSADSSSTVKEAVDNNVSAPSLSSALDVGYLGASKEEHVKASSALHGPRDISYCPREQVNYLQFQYND